MGSSNLLVARRPAAGLGELVRATAARSAVPGRWRTFPRWAWRRRASGRSRPSRPQPVIGLDAGRIVVVGLDRSLFGSGSRPAAMALSISALSAAPVRSINVKMPDRQPMVPSLQPHGDKAHHAICLDGYNPWSHVGESRSIGKRRCFGAQQTNWSDTVPAGSCWPV